jgi:nitroreductase
MIIDLIKKIIIKLFGRERIEFFRSKPFVVHGKYKKIIAEYDIFSNIINQEKKNKNIELTTLLNRKYAHIIDKGLHRVDVSKGHSVDISKELINTINIIEKDKAEKDETFYWSKNKLSIYESLQNDEIITALKDEKEKFKIDYNDFLQLIKSRRSNRQFIDMIVSETVLLKLAETVNYAPSSCNKQPIKLFVTNNPAIANECLKQCKGGTGFSEIIPCFISLCADMKGYYLPDELHLPYIDVSLGAQNLNLAMESFNLSGCSLSWAQKSKEEDEYLRKLLNIPRSYQIIFNMVIGYAEKEYLPPPRKAVKSTIQIIS